MAKRLDDKQLSSLAVDVRGLRERLQALDAERSKLAPLLAEKQIALDAAVMSGHSA